MNVLMLLKPKETVKYIYDSNTLRQGLEKMRAHSYTAIPVISEDGKYVGTVSEGDFLYYIVDLRRNVITEKEKHRVSDIIRKSFNPAVRIDVSMDELFNRAIYQNFVPVVDDFGTFIGIVTRQDIIRYFTKKQRDAAPGPAFENVHLSMRSSTAGKEDSR